MGFPWQDGNVYAEHSGTDKLTGQSYLHTAVLGVSYLVHYLELVTCLRRRIPKTPVQEGVRVPILCSR